MEGKGLRPLFQPDPRLHEETPGNNSPQTGKIKLNLLKSTSSEKNPRNFFP